MSDWEPGGEGVFVGPLPRYTVAREQSIKLKGLGPSIPSVRAGDIQRCCPLFTEELFAERFIEGWELIGHAVVTIETRDGLCTLLEWLMEAETTHVGIDFATHASGKIFGHISTVEDLLRQIRSRER